MKIKINQSIKLELDQLEELSSIFKEEPDMRWGIGSHFEKLDNIYLVEHQGEFGTYLYRVNLIKNLITVLKVS